MEVLNFFPTSVWIDYCTEIDNKKLVKKIYKFEKDKKSEKYSNVGGYQGHLLGDKNFYNSVASRIPRRSDKPFKKWMIYDWVNINRKGDYNKRHLHFDGALFLSGVYYVKVPKNSGNIIFYDPRGQLVNTMPDHKYYNDGTEYQYIEPQEGMILFFPTWIEHEVEENRTDEDRISIAFNILVE